MVYSPDSLCALLFTRPTAVESADLEQAITNGETDHLTPSRAMLGTFNSLPHGCVAAAPPSRKTARAFTTYALGVPQLRPLRRTVKSLHYNIPIRQCICVPFINQYSHSNDLSYDGRRGLAVDEVVPHTTHQASILCLGKWVPFYVFYSEILLS